VLLILLVLLTLLELVLKNICADGTSRCSTKTAEKTTARGARSPSSGSSTNEGSRKTALTVGAGLSGRVLAWSATLLGISWSTVLRIVLVLGRVGWWAVLLAVALLWCGGMGAVAGLLVVGGVLGLLLVVAPVALRLLMLSVLRLGVLLLERILERRILERQSKTNLLRIAALLTVLRLAIVLLLRVTTTLLAVAAVGIAVIIVGGHFELCLLVEVV
jgi:hypothetical protein